MTRIHLPAFSSTPLTSVRKSWRTGSGTRTPESCPAHLSSECSCSGRASSSFANEPLGALFASHQPLRSRPPDLPSSARQRHVSPHSVSSCGQDRLAGRVPLSPRLCDRSRCSSLGSAPSSSQAGGNAAPDRLLLLSISALTCSRGRPAVMWEFVNPALQPSSHPGACSCCRAST